MAARKSCRHHRTLLVQNCREMRIVDVAQCLLDDTPPITPRDDVAPAVRAMPAHQGERLVDAIELARRGQRSPCGTFPDYARAEPSTYDMCRVR